MNRSIVVALSLSLSAGAGGGGCATVTQTRTLEAEPGRSWLNEAGSGAVIVDSPGQGTARGRIISAVGGAIQLSELDGQQRAIPVRDGTMLRQKTRTTGIIIGMVTGIALGLTTGLILTDQVGTPNQDSAGGVEHPPLLAPLGALAGLLIGTIVGGVIGTERRLEVHAPPP